MKISVSELRPNPFRDMRRYPINPIKIETLVESIKSTSFWDNIVARPTKNDGYELAYGHHRLHALKKAKVEEINIPIRSIDDATMMKMMANENMEEWGANAAIIQETIRAVVEAYGEGRIELNEPDKKTPRNEIRNAPSFLMDVRGATLAHPYTADTIAEFLGKAWSVDRVKTFLQLLEMEEKELLTPSLMEGLTPTAAMHVGTQMRRYEDNPTIAKAVGKEIAKELREQKLATSSFSRRRIKDRASTVAAKHGYRQTIDKKKPKQLPDQDIAAAHLAEDLEKFLPAIMTRCRQMTEVTEFIGERSRAKLAKAIRKHIAIWSSLADKLEK